MISTVSIPFKKFSMELVAIVIIKCEQPPAIQ